MQVRLPTPSWSVRILPRFANFLTTGQVRLSKFDKTGANSMLRKNRSILMMPLLALAMSLAAARTASAQTCSNVDVTIKNSTSDEIKVKRFEYLDGALKRACLVSTGFRS
jgi:hypothetical protein